MNGSAETNQDRHILLAVDNSENAKHAVLYVADFLAGVPGFRITLVNVLTPPLQECFAGQEERLEWVEESRKTAGQLTENFRQLLVSSGFPEEKVATEVVVNDYPSIAECILACQKRLDCCTVVMGRRGISLKEEFIFGSTSNRILHARKNCAVWVIE